MKHPEKMTVEELIEYNTNLKRMIHGLQIQLTKAMEAVAEMHAERILAKRHQNPIDLPC